MIRVPAPALDPAEALLRVARGDRPFLLDGGIDVDGLGRYSFAGCDPDDGLVVGQGDAGDPLALLEAAQRRWNVGPVDEHWPIAVGYLTYDLGALALARASGRQLRARDDLGLPLIDFARYRAVWRLDGETGRAEVLAHDGASAARLLRRLERASLTPATSRVALPRWTTEAPEYRRRVERVLEYLRAGDCYQVNLSHRLVAAVDDEAALGLYLRLRAGSPAPLGAYLRSGACTVLSNSPERFLRLQSTALETRPIKGTRGRSADSTEDARLAEELGRAAKDAAEHLMIVDLERNDLGRVALTGSVEVVDYGRHVALPTVHHLVSTVRARIRPGIHTAEVLAATLPGGSITGAPKLRAVEIIDELEQVQRGLYCGALGWLGAGGAMDLALPIRTAVVRGGELILSVGGGIVADSQPDEELEETRVKAAAFLRALA